MNLLTAIAHIGGAIFAVVVLAGVSMWLGAWETERAERRFREEMGLAIDVPVTELDREELAPKLVGLLAERFSTELLRNRLSDFCGSLRTVWGWFGSIVQIALLSWVLWITFAESLENAAYAWFIVAVTLFFWVSSMVFSFACRLLTGRYPGQAKQARKYLAEFVATRANVHVEHEKHVHAA